MAGNSYNMSPQITYLPIIWKEWIPHRWVLGKLLMSSDMGKSHKDKNLPQWESHWLTMNFISFYPWIFLLKLRTEDSQLNYSFQKDGKWTVTHLTVSDFWSVNNFYILRVNLSETSVAPAPLVTVSGWSRYSRWCLEDFHQLDCL